MLATVLQESLNRGLATVSRVITGRGQLPILANVLIECAASGITLTATNLDLGMRVNIGGKVEKEGAITVPARNLADFVSNLTGESIQLEEDSGKLLVRAGKFEGVFAGIGASEFPSVAKIVEPGVKIDRKMIGEIASKVAWSAAMDDSRPVLTGIKFSVVSGQLSVTATDGFRMSRKVVSGGSSMTSVIDNLILPARTIQELAKIVSEGRKEEVEMSILVDSNQVVFEYDKTELVSRVLEGNFPDIDRVIPKESKTVVLVDQEALNKAVRAVAVFAREGGNTVKLSVVGDKLLVAGSSQQSGKSEVEIDVDIEGDDGEISFNYKFVVDFLNSMDSGKRVKMIFNGPMVAGMWMVEGDETLTHLIMPIRN